MWEDDPRAMTNIRQKNAPPLTGQNRRWVLADRPVGREVRESDFALETQPVPDLRDGEFLVRTLYLSVAPVMRHYMLQGGAGERPLQFGEVMRGRGVGVVVASRNPRFAPGEFVQGKLGWQEYSVSDGSPYFMMYKIEQRIAPLSTGIGVLGVTGFTSYLGLMHIGQLQRGDRVLVSGAAGGVGSSVAQIAKHHGASRVVGIAGSAEKCRMLVERLGYDAAIDYRREDLQTRLGELLPEGFDVMFDNVGGETLDTALLHLRMDARVVLCGRISEYLGDEEQPYALRNYQRLHKRYGSLRGFFIYRLESMFPAAERAMAEMIHAGALTHAEDVLEGLERMPEALIRLYSGANRGKQLVRVDPQAETYRDHNPWRTV
jgi:NADPH-dependent curcumin reductase CurA